MIELSNPKGKRKMLCGVPIMRGGTKLSYLFSTDDDSLLFCKANVVEWSRVHALLPIYEKALGQKLNMEKTSIYRK